MRVRRAERADAAAVRRVAADAIRRTFGGVGGCGSLVAGAERPGVAAEVAAWLPRFSLPGELSAPVRSSASSGYPSLSDGVRSP